MSEDLPRREGPPGTKDDGAAPGLGLRVEDEAYDIRIARDGTWFHEGTPIGRKALVKLFASVLRRDETGDFWLITPAERGRITVEDAPFIAIDFDRIGADLRFRTNLDHEIVAGPDHPIRIARDGGSDPSIRPYIMVKPGLEALIARPAFYRLVEVSVERDGRYGVWSGAMFFPLEVAGG